MRTAVLGLTRRCVVLVLGVLSASCSHMDAKHSEERGPLDYQTAVITLYFEGNTAMRNQFKALLEEKLGKENVRCKVPTKDKDCKELEDTDAVIKVIFILPLEQQADLLTLLLTLGPEIRVNLINVTATPCPSPCSVQWLTCRVYACRKPAPDCGTCPPNAPSSSKPTEKQ